MAYISRQDLIDFINLFRSDISKSDIPEIQFQDSTSKVNNELIFRGIIPDTVSDDWNQLMFAELCFFMETSNMLGQVQTIYGDVKSEQIGNWKTEFNTAQPMFFFAQGAGGGMYKLLPHLTWLQHALKYIEGYVKFHQRQNSSKQYACVSTDNTARGYGWDDSISDVTRDRDKWDGN